MRMRELLPVVLTVAAMPRIETPQPWDYSPREGHGGSRGVSMGAHIDRMVSKRRRMNKIAAKSRKRNRGTK